MLLDQRSAGVGVYNWGMSGRGLRLLLCFAVLGATGLISAMPCCALPQLSPAASAELRDCCGSGECCRVEKPGPAPVVIAVRYPEIRSAAAFPAGHPAFPGDSAIASDGALARVSFFQSDLPPPLNGRGTHLRNSLLRI